MKNILKSIGIGFYFLFESTMAFILTYLLIFSMGGMIPTGELKSEGELYIYVKSNGVHTDLCFPVETSFFDWKTFVPLRHFPKVSSPHFISIGWGDKGFFLDTPEWSDLTFNTAFNAAFLKSGTAMHVTYQMPEPYISDQCAKVFINQSEYEILIDYVKKSFQLTNGKVNLIPNKGYWCHDNFYEANGNYHLFNTCNAWTNNALKLAGIKTGFFALSAHGIMSHLVD